MRTLQRLLRSAPLLVAAALLWPLSASATPGAVTHIQQAGDAERPLIVAVSDKGIVFLNDEDALFRGFRHERTARTGFDQPWLWISDIDNDRNREFVGAGRPAFVVDHNADPVWGVPRGCEQFWLGTFVEPRGQEILCRNGSTVEITTWNGQTLFVWEGGRGYQMGACYIDDFTGNQRLDLACERGNDHLLFNFAMDGPQENDGPVPTGNARGGANLSTTHAAARGERALDLGGQEVTLEVNGDIVQVRAADGAPVGSAHTLAGGIHSAFAAELRPGEPRLYLGGVDQVHVLDAEGGLVATVAADPTRLTRDARVTIRNASANRIEDASRETITGLYEARLGDFRQCYARQMGDDQTTRVGTINYQLTIDGNGRVSRALRRHTDLRSDPLESCIENILTGMRFSPAEEGEGVSMISLDFDFVDRP